MDFVSQLSFLLSFSNEIINYSHGTDLSQGVSVMKLLAFHLTIYGKFVSFLTETSILCVLTFLRVSLFSFSEFSVFFFSYSNRFMNFLWPALFALNPFGKNW